jgi:hypothetical protein
MTSRRTRPRCSGVPRARPDSREDSPRSPLRSRPLPRQARRERATESLPPANLRRPEDSAGSEHWWRVPFRSSRLTRLSLRSAERGTARSTAPRNPRSRFDPSGRAGRTSAGPLLNCDQSVWRPPRDVDGEERGVGGKSYPQKLSTGCPLRLSLVHRHPQVLGVFHSRLSTDCGEPGQKCARRKFHIHRSRTLSTSSDRLVVHTVHTSSTGHPPELCTDGG